jgi:hypothetical protein
MIRVSLLLILAGLACHSSAFAPISIAREARISKTGNGSPFVLYATEDASEEEKSATPEEAPVAARPPPPVPPKRLDPLMASLTRMDPDTANGPTRNLPLFGEVPVDGSLVVLVPVVVIAVIGFVASIVVASQAQDEIVNAFAQIGNGISQTASEKTNMVYDESVCRGLCSSQDQDLEGLRSFMDRLRK